MRYVLDTRHTENALLLWHIFYIRIMTGYLDRGIVRVAVVSVRNSCRIAVGFNLALFRRANLILLSGSLWMAVISLYERSGLRVRRVLITTWGDTRM